MITIEQLRRYALFDTAPDEIAAEDVADTVRQAAFLMRAGNADIDIDVELAEDPMPARFDRRLISQGLTNIIKNATEAIEAVPAEESVAGQEDVRVAAAAERRKARLRSLLETMGSQP